jgi:1,4-alpha-glucan branching enzyme
MPGDPWQQAANLRLLYGHMFGHPGKKLLFMGCEFGQRGEWSYNHAIDWPLLEDPLHAGVQQWIRDLNKLYREHSSMWRDSGDAFFWVDHADYMQSVVSYVRHDKHEKLLFVFNYTPVPRECYLQGFPEGGAWTEILNSDAALYGGGDVGNAGIIDARTDIEHHGQPASAEITIPPLGMLVFACASN